ncbi:Hypothetical predicted protein [Olea europaea subsp. europaea]|uniref:Uncharacterized protein n=1 Tax=Olea europaea subsp. europaea TaxID=158383 RepID=A0A8S0T477_OLEEU|nr:Hypothetical predicted protein [Olea europaea subsp. europaea]
MPEEAPKGRIPSSFLSHHVVTYSRCRSRLNSPSTANGFGTGTPMPSPQSQSFSQSYESILPTFFAYIVPLIKGCSPWKPDTVMSTIGCGRYSILQIFKGRRGCTRHHETCSGLPATGPYLRLSNLLSGHDRLTHVQVLLTWNLSPLRPLKFPFEYLILPQRFATTNTLPGLMPKNSHLSSSYPEENFEENQLLDGSISLSPLYPSQTNDLHVSITAGLHQSFLWLHPAQAHFTIFWVPIGVVAHQGHELPPQLGRWNFASVLTTRALVVTSILAGPRSESIVGYRTLNMMVVFAKTI